MPKERFFTTSALEEKAILTIDDSEFHHLVNVMRAKESDEVELVNGKGVLANAIVQTIEKKRAHLFIDSVIKEEPDPFRIILAQSLPRLNRLDFILEKATELGATDIWLFPGVLSERKFLSESQIERANAVLIAAMKQCGRLYLPNLLFKPALKEWKKLEYPAFFGDVEKDVKPFLEVWKKSPEDKGIIFFIGCESGFTEKETSHLKELKALNVSLNRNILRTDTAAITALSLIAHGTS